MTSHSKLRIEPSYGLRARLADAILAARTLPLLVFLAGAASCQSDADGLNTVKNTDIKAPSSKVEETFGETGTEITLLLPRGASGVYEGAARDVRDGAALSVGELGNGQVFIKVVDVSGGAGAVPAAVSAAKARNSSLLISYASPAVTSAIAAMSSDQRPPLVNLGDDVPAIAGNVYNFASDELDSALEGIRTAAAGGHKKVMVFAPKDFPPASEVRLADAVRAGGGTYAGTARYDLSDAAAADVVQKSKAQLQQADTVVILGKSVIVPTVAGAIKASGQANLVLVGTSAWPSQAYADPAVAGAMIAMVEPDDASLIADRYKRHHGRTLSSEAAYGYDSVAIAAGIIRVKGPAGLTAENLTMKTGFRGVTGLFRLTPGGNVERKLSLFTITGGRLSLLGAAPKAF
ncbi:ABC transporter substrate-binding protein [Rhizobium mongolense]|uniref:Leucine-binding protein domain-containing protein n=1 Tax=Rhizobium mongolense TaxID=57676 RepID=A0A7W6WE93_9HYPH|nr:hypothetical protein [Rhizobium mongolense]MBB4274399.1 hypothetical protein [Rhizobium mongolense]